MNVFHEDDHPQLYAPPAMFDRDALAAEHGPWGGQLLRNAVALEFMAQLAAESADFVVKGGTLLQSRLRWPPRRASVDLDIEVTDAKAAREAIDRVVSRFPSSHLVVADGDTPVPGFVVHIDFPNAQGTAPPLRIDVLEHLEPPQGVEPWRDQPKPWQDAPAMLAPPLETQAAQKLLLSARPPYGRDISDHRGRQNLVKDLFDLACMAEHDLDTTLVIAAVHEDVHRKQVYLDRPFKEAEILAEAQNGWLNFLHAPPGTARRASLWRAHDRLQRTFRTTFLVDDARIGAGCAHYALAAIGDDILQWNDAWIPLVERRPRRAWSGAEEIVVVQEPDGGFGPTKGLREAWAVLRPPA